jgi:hypothetical protein
MIGPRRTEFTRGNDLKTVGESDVELETSEEKRELNRSVFLKPRLSILGGKGPLWSKVIFSDTAGPLSNCLKNGT